MIRTFFSGRQLRLAVAIAIISALAGCGGMPQAEPSAQANVEKRSSATQAAGTHELPRAQAAPRFRHAAEAVDRAVEIPVVIQPEVSEAPYQVVITAEPAVIAAGEKTSLILSTPVAATVQISGIGAVSSPGTVTVTPTATTTYFASAPNGSSSEAQVRVIPSGDLNSSIKHVVIYMQENRSFDNYFGRLGAYRQKRGIPGQIDGLNLDRVIFDPYGHEIRPFHFESVCHEPVSPSWNESHYSAHMTRDGYLMDRFALTTGSVPQVFDLHGTRVMGYYDERDLPFYYELASQFATSDRTFSALMSSTAPNRQYLFAASSFGHVKPDGRTEPARWDQKTIFDLLNEAGITWRYYDSDDSVFLAAFRIWNDLPSRENVRPISEYYEILSRPTADQDLPQVVFLERYGNSDLDERPGVNIQLGAQVTESHVRALMNSTAWPNSVFFFTYDEAGGMADHVPPIPAIKPDDIAPMLEPGHLPGEFNETGFRVPFVVISPWAKRHYVSHTPRDFTSILAFIQTRFNLPPLTRRDAAQPSMLEFFDFSSPQLLNVPPLPAQPANGVCDWERAMEPGHINRKPRTPRQ